MVFTSDQIWDGGRGCFSSVCFPDFLGLDLVDGSFSEEGIMDITKVFVLMVIVVRKDDSSILYSFSGIKCPFIKILVKVMEQYWGKKGWISRIDII